MTNFELHLTTSSLAINQLDEFKHVCQQLQTKPLLIELARGVYCQQPMATAHLSCQFNEVLGLAEQLSQQFTQLNFAIKRIKIEAPLDTLSIKAIITKTSPRYFEWHGKLQLHAKESLLKLCQDYGAHLSHNAIRGEANLHFVSIRRPLGDSKAFRHYVQSFVEQLEKGGWTLLKQQFEQVLYDSCIDLDTGWLAEVE